MLRFARLKISGIVYYSYIVYRKRFLEVVHKKPAALVSRNIGKYCFLLFQVSHSIKDYLAFVIISLCSMDNEFVTSSDCSL